MATQKRKWVPAKVDPTFIEKIRKTAVLRVKSGVDKTISKEQASVRRFTKAMTRYEPLWKILKEAKFTE